MGDSHYVLMKCVPMSGQANHLDHMQSYVSTIAKSFGDDRYGRFARTSQAHTLKRLSTHPHFVGKSKIGESDYC